MAIEKKDEIKERNKSKYKVMFAFAVFIQLMAIMLFIGVWAPIKLLFVTAAVTKIAAMPVFDLFTKWDHSLFTYEAFKDAYNQGQLAEVYIKPAVGRLVNECNGFKQDLQAMRGNLAKVKSSFTAFKAQTVASMDTVTTSASDLAANMSKTCQKASAFGVQVKEKAGHLKTMFTELASAITEAASFGKVQAQKS